MKSILRSDVTIIALGQLVQQVITMFTGVVLARLIGASGYGVINLLRTLLTGLMTVAPLGLDLALLKYCGRHGVEAPHVLLTMRRLRVVTLAFNATITLVVGVGFGGVLMRDVYTYEHFDTLLLLTLISLPFAADLGIMSAYYKAKGRPGLFALMTIYFQSGLRLVGVGVVFFFWPTVTAVVSLTTLQIVASSLIVIVQGRAVALPSRDVARGAPPVAWREASDVLRDSVWMALNLLVYGLMRFVDILMLGYYLPAREVGEYAALSIVSQLVQVYPLAASQTLGPAISRHFHAGEPDRVRGALDGYISLAALVSGFIFAGVAIFGPRLDLVFGESFHFRQDVSLLMPFGYLLSATLAPTGYALSMTGRHRVELAILCLGGITLLVLCWRLIPLYGQFGAAIAVAAAFFVVNVVRFAFVARVLGFVPGRWRDMLPPVVALLLAYVARELVDTVFARTFPALLAACVLYTAFFALACWTLLLAESTRSAIALRLRGQVLHVRRWLA